MKLDITPLSQLDPRWKDKKLGTSASSIGNYGCALVCVTLLANYYTGQNLTPDEMNAKLVAANGFANKNLMKWEALSAIFPQITFDRRIDCPDSPAPLETVDQYLGAGKPVIALVDYNPATKEIEQHFVLIVGKDAGDYFIADPMCQPGDGVYYLSAKYGQPAKAICGLRLYSGPVPQEKPSESPTEAQDNDLEQEKRMNELTEKVVANTNELRILKDKIESLDLVIGNIKVDTTELYRDREVLTAIKEQLTVVDGKVETNLAKQTTIETSLRQEIRAFGCSFDAKIQALSQRIKVLEERPVPLDNTIKIKLKVGRWFIGKITG